MGEKKTKVLREKGLRYFMDNKHRAPLGTCCSQFATEYFALISNQTLKLLSSVSVFCVRLGAQSLLIPSASGSNKKANLGSGNDMILPRNLGLCSEGLDYHGNRS